MVTLLTVSDVPDFPEWNPTKHVLKYKEITFNNFKNMNNIREAGLKCVLWITLLLIHLRYVYLHDFDICVMFMMVALKCFPTICPNSPSHNPVWTQIICEWVFIFRRPDEQLLISLLYSCHVYSKFQNFQPINQQL